jgi:hypothetical protein
MNLGRTDNEKRIRTKPDYYTYPANVFILFEEALKLRPDEAESALNKEIDNAESKDIWHGVLESDLKPDSL